MSRERLRWITIVLPIAILAFAQVMAMVLLEPVLGDEIGHWVTVGILAIGVVVFSTVVFRVLDRLQQQMLQQNKELSALNAVARAVSGPLELPEAVGRALANVVEVTGASAGEIVLRSEEPDEEPLSLSQGATDELRRLEGIWAEGEDQKDATAPAGAVRIVDLQRVRQVGASEACERGFETLVCVPLAAQNRLVGDMRLLGGKDSHLASEGSERLLAAMGSQIAIAIQASHLFRDVARRGSEAQALHEIGMRITSLQDIRRILRSVVEEAGEIPGAEAVALCLVQGNGEGLALADCSGPEVAFCRRPVPVPPFPALPNSASEMPSQRWTGLRCRALAAEYRACHATAPLVVGTTTIGELCVASRVPRPFAERHREILAGLADMAAIAINNARLLEGQRYLAVLEERERLSREMHDSLAQALGYLHLRARTAQRTLQNDDPAKVNEQLNDMASLAHEAYHDVREAVLALRETVSPSAGILATLSEYLQKFSRQAGIEAKVEIEADEVPRFSPDVEVQLVRAIQEALTNVRKHARAGGAWVRISRQNDEFVICVEDNGQGFDPALVDRPTGRHFGVRTMRERIERVGGRFDIESSPGCGTRVRIYFPQEEGEQR